MTSDNKKYYRDQSHNGSGNGDGKLTLYDRPSEKKKRRKNSPNNVVNFKKKSLVLDINHQLLIINIIFVLSFKNSDQGDQKFCLCIKYWSYLLNGSARIIGYTHPYACRTKLNISYERCCLRCVAFNRARDKEYELKLKLKLG